MPQSQSQYAENILSVYFSASYSQLENGENWYLDAYNIAAALTAQYRAPIQNVAGVIAAVSPMNSWGNNINLATRIIDNHFRGNPPITTGYLSQNLAKAEGILRHAYTFSDIVSYLPSQKVNAFFHCILAAGITDTVCVDRHALSIAKNERITKTTKLTVKQYDVIADAYREAAYSIAIPAAKLQAITWVVWRNRFWSEGAFD